MEKKVFVIINSYYMGDILLANSLVQNIKRLYSDSIVVMLTPTKFVDIAKYQDGVDDVVVWERHFAGNKIKGMQDFVKNFPYKNIYATFVVYGSERAMVLARMLRSKYVLAPNKMKFFAKFLRKKKYRISDDYTRVQTMVMNLLRGITKQKLVDTKIRFNLPQFSLTEKLCNLPSKYIAVCPISSKIEKDLSFEQLSDLLKKLDKANIVILGNGKSAEELSEKLKQEKFSNVYDLMNKTSVLEAARILNDAEEVVSVDTGLMHMACALDKRTIAIFYDKIGYQGYMPDSQMYDVAIVNENETVNKIVAACRNSI